ncbi:MAG: sulfur oxidation c-type cytochrome SoxA [Gammaproteobacteria bacterium]|nr:sulfur oxidation c-type cytochrome SoxA [Gammaproteobacteria bacterium]
MKKLLLIITTLSFIIGIPATGMASPSDDLTAFRAYFKNKFPNVAQDDYINGIYALDAERRAAWKEFEDFAPPYEDAAPYGKSLFNKPFANGKTYASCFENNGIGIRQNYPRFNSKTGKIVTLEGAINACRKSNGEKKLGWKKGKIAAISAYMASTSNGKRINVKIPNDPRALKIYERGKSHFYAKRGQLNFSCADCHVFGAGSSARANLLSPALGHVTHFPVWRKKWAKGKSGPTAGLGTIQRRYGGCNKQVRAKPFKAQKAEYNALEYFHAYMSNGLLVNSPGLRQ